MCWDVTVTTSCPPAESYIDRAALEAGAAVEMAATHKEEKFVDLGARYIFEPIPAVWRQFPGVFNASARHLLDDLGRISENSGEAHVIIIITGCAVAQHCCNNNNTVISIALFTDRPGALTTSDVCSTK